MTTPDANLSMDEYLRERLMPVEGAIPQIPGIEMYGNSVPVERVGGDFLEYKLHSSVMTSMHTHRQALKLSKEFLNPLPPGALPRNSVDDIARSVSGIVCDVW